jgi:hypothetical protein
VRADTGAFERGAPDRNRTCDLPLRRRLLYPLSYGGAVRCSVYARTWGIDGADLARLAPGASDPVDLVEASFAFLLEHEPKESILREFDLAVIGRYFPDYDRQIGRRLSR